MSKSKLLILGSLILSLLLMFSCSTTKNMKEVNYSKQSLTEKSAYVKEDLIAAEISVEESEEYGKYLTDGEGRTLYIFLADTKNESSNCYSRCAEVWPPLLTTANPEAAANDVNTDMLGTIERRDGSMQVTYNGWPLYYYAKDQGEGQLTGQDVKGFGAEWYLMAPSGDYIH